jgi:hypothetical protein
MKGPKCISRMDEKVSYGVLARVVVCRMARNRFMRRERRRGETADACFNALMRPGVGYL